MYPSPIEKIDSDSYSSYYCRMIDLSSVQKDMKTAALWQNLITALTAWLEVIPGIVVNRPGHQLHNFTKPFHEFYLQRCGLQIPPSLVT